MCPWGALNPTTTFVSRAHAKCAAPVGLGRLRMGGLAGCHWRRLPLWTSEVQGSRQHLMSCCNRWLQRPSSVCCQTSARLLTPVSTWKRDEGSSLQSPLPCRGGGVGMRGVLTSAPMSVPLHISLACTALFQSIPACIPLARVTAPCSPSSTLTALWGFVY